MRLRFIVESGTDVRLVEELARRFELQVAARRIEGGHEISQPTDAPFRLSIGPPSPAAFGRWLLRSLLRERTGYDAVMVQGYGIAALAANLAGWWTGHPTVMLICSPTEAYYACRRLDSTGRPFRASEWHGLRVLARLNARCGQRYVVLSAYLGDVVRRHGTRRPIEVVPVYGVDTATFRPGDEPRSALRDRLGLPASAALVFFSSRVAPEKDPDTLLEALAQLRASGRDVRVLHRSGGHAEFVRRAAAAGLSDAIIAGDAVAPGAVLADHYRASDVCVQASREEGLGFSVLEALACGTPVVAAAVGGLHETVRDPQTGWTYPAGNAGALAHALENALDHPDEGRRRALRGRALVIRSYERNLVFDRLADVLLRQRGATAGAGVPQRATGK